MRGMVVPSVVYFLLIIATRFHCCNGHKAICREEEREALLSFKRGLVDPSNRLSSWVDEECCEWEGVLCHNKTGHVVQLDLRRDAEQNKSALGGEIRSSLLGLKYLQYLDLSYNDFGRLKIPKFFGSLSDLRYLNLSTAGFGGVVPHQLGNLSKLHYLDIGDSQNHPIKSLNVEDVEWISGLPSLLHLDMTNVNLSRASNWLQVMNRLPSLSVLRLRYCALPAIDPLPHVNFSSLHILDLSRNHLISSSFDWLADLRSLTNLNLENNEIHGQIPSGLRNMTSLIFLDLSGNYFVGSFPDWLFKITTLEYLDLGYNMFKGKLPNDIGNLTSVKLQFLSMRGNQLSGSFPDALGECKSLQVLDLGMNRLSGHFPNELGQLKSLSSIFIDANLFSGVVSEKHLINLSSLEELDASLNLQLTVQLSSNWTPPFQLRYLDLGSCLLGPQFPAWLQTQKHLEELYVPHAGISGVVPTWFWTRTYDTVDLSNNQIIGSIPSLLSSNMFLGSNNFTNPLPQIPSSLIRLDLSNNLFHGSLSPMLCQRNKEENLLKYLDISTNLLSGELPDCWMHWRELTRLNLDSNNLKGRIPTSMGSLIWLGSLHLRNNHLSGDIPLSMKNCSSLLVLDLSENEFSGSIPAWMGNFSGKFVEIFLGADDKIYTPGLMVLVLRSNKFNGSIPLELCHLDSLQFLDLASNNLSGIVPRCFGNFSQMTKPPNSTSPFFFHNDYYFMWGRTDAATVVMNGVEYKYENTLGLLADIDLSDNKLSGGIPEELTGLLGLISLNLSHNHLQGKIPVKIGDMKSLVSLDLSMNRLSGVIPQGMATMSFLGRLNLSYNNLSGKIPSGTQLRGFNPFSFIGNPELCGVPLTHDCDEDRKPKLGDSIPAENDGEEESGWIDLEWFYLAMPWGFVVGFWSIVAPLAFKRAWRHAYFRFLGEMNNKLLGWCL